MSYGVNKPSGFVPKNLMGSSETNGGLLTFNISGGYNTSIGSGDPVAASNTGYITLGVPGSTCLGVFQGCYYYTNLGAIQKKPGWTANQQIQTNTVVTANVTVDPNTVYSVQTNGVTGAGFTNLFNNANFATGTVSTLGYSTATLDLSTLNTTDTLNFKIIGLDDHPDNKWSVGGNFPYNNVLVVLNNGFFRAGVAGI